MARSKVNGSFDVRKPRGHRRHNFPIVKSKGEKAWIKVRRKVRRNLLDR